MSSKKQETLRDRLEEMMPLGLSPPCLLRGPSSISLPSNSTKKPNASKSCAYRSTKSRVTCRCTRLLSQQASFEQPDKRLNRLLDGSTVSEHSQLVKQNKSQQKQGIKKLSNVWGLTKTLVNWKTGAKDNWSVIKRLRVRLAACLKW